MIDDIVTRLLEQTKECEWCNCDCCEVRHCVHCQNASLAVVEIERLRKQIRQLETERDHWQRQAISHG
jgi:hypothetical protein